MKFTKLFAAGATVLIAGSTLAACGSNSNSSSSSAKKTINWMDSAEIPTMDISKATDVTSFNQLGNVEEGLYRLGKNSKVENALATDTKVSKDGKTWTFTLRDSKWSNGDKLTAKDFVYSWRRTVNPKTASQYAYLFEGIHNATQISAGKAPVNSLGVKAEGDNKLVVTLDKRIPYFKLLMGFPLFFPQNQKVVEANGSKYGTSSKTTAFNGPFVQKGWTGSNLSWKLVKNKNYWDKKNVKLDAINYSVQKTPSTAYNLYQSNKLDATILDSQQTKNLKHQKGYTLRDTAATFYLQFNQKKKIFQNADLRRAISMSINRKALGSALGGANTPATSLTSKGVVNHDGKDWSEVVGDKKNAAYNPTEAKKLYKKALKELGVKNVSFTILSDDTDSGQKTTETLQSQLEENLKGMKVSVANVPFKTRLNRSTNGNFDVVVSGWSADFADPISFVDLFTSKNAQNNGKWSNSQYDKLIADSKTTADTTKRWDDLEKAEKILLSDEGIAPLYYKTEAWLVRPDIKGIVYNGAGLNYNFKNTYVAN
ncbi:peptide ABC transporter substrate-binding protein [Lactobacillus crispatus]|uniref:Peptide ABC transporter substrate-binding protein n=1 Tax=Lactobacillus crispatus TaxID=47770 RepID=A0A2I1WJV2_9LACO|nr:peptide ABC transporter substrate-binding protein [Lactobacillus crispatus]KAB1976614.1 peptide ABC transporter substrate-binding protein [Lactobacillus crispatus]MBI1696857.1 peptide ABC transporter substrate-binding protein [Lactobacillus crispatus]MCT3538272.1 peptide ABC transporter substrate-binding protein [Lactobacillus crispatus]MCT7861397.1 peptide ABC transporter substrate-binding protein [Lactobacillus crispatus]MDK6377660.1 peptide ABC transporter substrate-binding protein [Lact